MHSECKSRRHGVPQEIFSALLAFGEAHPDQQQEQHDHLQSNSHSASINDDWHDMVGTAMSYLKMTGLIDGLGSHVRNPHLAKLQLLYQILALVRMGSSYRTRIDANRALEETAWSWSLDEFLLLFSYF